jgi:uncharacterized damage-inducible protein DinB
MSTATQTMDAAMSAATIRDFLASAIEGEFAATKKVLVALKPGDWKPDPKSRSAKELAWHLVASEIWFLNGIASQDFTPADEKAFMPDSLEGIVKYYEAEYPKAIARVRQIPAQQMAGIADFYGMKLPNTTLLGFALVHSVHHRAQLSTYLRPLGSKCPDIYGGSADFPWQG